MVTEEEREKRRKELEQERQQSIPKDSPLLPEVTKPSGGGGSAQPEETKTKEPQIIRDQDTGRITGVKLASGKTFLTRDIDTINAILGKKAPQPTPAGAVEAADVAAQRQQQQVQEELIARQAEETAGLREPGGLLPEEVPIEEQQETVQPLANRYEKVIKPDGTHVLRTPDGRELEIVTPSGTPVTEKMIEEGEKVDNAIVKGMRFVAVSILAWAGVSTLAAGVTTTAAGAKATGALSRMSGWKKTIMSAIGLGSLSTITTLLTEQKFNEIKGDISDLRTSSRDIVTDVGKDADTDEAIEALHWLEEEIREDGQALQLANKATLKGKLSGRTIEPFMFRQLNAIVRRRQAIERYQASLMTYEELMAYGDPLDGLEE